MIAPTNRAGPAPAPPGLLCVVEGIDGSGKSTLLSRLGAALQTQGLRRHFGDRFHELRELREPTRGAVGRQIRAYLQSGRQLAAAEWLDLFFADRSENVQTNIQPALAAGALVIQDRYFYSTAAYQGGGSRSARQILNDSLAAGFPEPGAILYLDIAPEAAMRRIQRRARPTTETTETKDAPEVGNEREAAGLESFETLEQLRRIHANYDRVLPPHTLRLDATLPPGRLCEIALAHLKATAGPA